MHASLGSAWRVLVAVAALFFVSLLADPRDARAESHLTVLPPQAHVGDAHRLALVIGNSAYRNVATLKNTVNDATAVAAKLREVGYQVYFGRDLDRRDMNAAINDFLAAISAGDEVLVYYSGHGVELQGSNYLLPIDVPRLGVDQERLFRSEAVNLTELLLDLQARSARVSLVILDACRDNPYQVAGTTRSLGAKRGLARVDPPQGAFVIFSAGVGEGALDSLGDDDRDPNGLFTRKFLKLITVEGIELRTMVRQLRTEVREAALASGGGAQVPSYYDQLLGDFYFMPSAGAKPTPCDMLVKTDASKDEVLQADPELGFKACAQATAEFPNEPRFVHLLYNAQEQKAARHALKSDETGPSEAYVALFPSGRFLADVRTHLADLAARAQAAKLETAKAEAAVAAARAEAAKLEAERTKLKTEAARAEAERAEAAKTAAAKAEAERIEEQAAKAEAAKAQAERAQARADAAKAQQEKAAAEEALAKAKAAQAEATKQEAEKAQAAKIEAERALARAQTAKDEAAKAEAARDAAVTEATRAAAAKDAAAKEAAAKEAAANEATKLALNTPPTQPMPAPPPQTVPAIDPGDLARLLQVHLKRVGCDPGSADGEWNENSQHALESFNTYAKTQVDVKVASLDALDAVRSKTSRVCPLTCDRRSRPNGDRCVAITCDQGFVLDARGHCEKIKERPRPVVKHEAPVERHVAPAAPRPAGNAKCFNFNGKQFCE